MTQPFFRNHLSFMSYKKPIVIAIMMLSIVYCMSYIHNSFTRLSPDPTVKQLSLDNNTMIDIVYLWVNGSDPEWRSEKQYYESAFSITSPDAIGDERFVEHDELRYSLRSVAKFASWIHNIFIVTNGQIPYWLDLNHPRIHVVSHSEIMPTSSLPTFNSYAIEANIHKIPGLSNMFLFTNDDCYFWDYVTASYFFTIDGKPRIRIGQTSFKKAFIEKEQYARNIVYSSRLVKQVFHKRVLFEPIHMTLPYRKELYEQCAQLFHNEFNNTTHQQFRGENNVHRSIVTYYSLIHKKVVLVSQEESSRTSFYTRIVSPNCLNKELRTRKPKLVCINDGPTVLQRDRDDLRPFLRSWFPNRQRWERD